MASNCCVQAYVRLIDAYYALSRYRDAADAVTAAVRRDANFKALPEYKVSGTGYWGKNPLCIQHTVASAGRQLQRFVCFGLCNDH